MIPEAIAKAPMHPFKICVGCTRVAIEVSYEELLTNRYSPILTMSSRPSQNSLLVFSLWPTCGAYALITLRTKSSTTSLTRIIRSPRLLTSTTPYLRLLLIKMPRHFYLEPSLCTTAWSRYPPPPSPSVLSIWFLGRKGYQHLSSLLHQLAPEVSYVWQKKISFGPKCHGCVIFCSVSSSL